MSAAGRARYPIRTNDRGGCKGRPWLATTCAPGPRYPANRVCEPGGAWRTGLVKTVCAFLNGDGGTLLIGVAEADDLLTVFPCSSEVRVELLLAAARQRQARDAGLVEVHGQVRSSPRWPPDLCRRVRLSNIENRQAFRHSHHIQLALIGARSR